MDTSVRSNGVWDIRSAVRRMGEGFYSTHRDACQKAGVVANATAGIPLKKMYEDPATDVLAKVLANVSRPGMVGEDLLSRSEQRACRVALDRILAALSALPAPPNLYAIATRPGDFQELVPLFAALDGASPYVCVPFVQPNFDPVFAKESLDAMLALLGPDYTYADLYEREPSPSMKADFNRVLVRAKRAGLLVELVGIRKPAAACYVSDPADDRWDVRSCVPPENAVLFKEVHQKVNTMAYLMAGLNYGDFFELPVAHAKVLPHFRARVDADKNYWFTVLEKERILAAIDAILAFLAGAPEHAGLRFRDLYSDPGAPAEILVQFQRMLDVKPELCLPFMRHDFDHAEAADAIDPFLARNASLSLKQLYTEAPGATPPADMQAILQSREATMTLLGKINDLTCAAPGYCVPCPDDWCSTEPVSGNCRTY